MTAFTKPVTGRPETSDCTCEHPSEYNDGGSYDRHEITCALAPNISDWLWYAHDGELENGGVYVHPENKDCIYLLVNGYLVRVPHSTE
jgi:hypothetical protein